ncbi:MAG: hypothetical protein KF780_00945 [Sphingomonas sp.]|nr:hypothetical protein [Sphingomonas sp.]
MTTARRLLPLIAIFALLVAPFGRIGMAEAAATLHHAAPMAMAGHCEDMAAPDHGPTGKAGKAAIDCMIACAAVAPMPLSQIALMIVPAAMPGDGGAPAAFDGLHPGADPPPPRFA